MSDSKQRAEYAISVKDVTKVYKLYEKPIDRLKESVSPTHKNYHRDFYALNGLSFNVKKGETVGIIGTNGSGKSTILKIITGVLTPSTGQVQVNGKISALLELGAGFNMDYTGIENIYMNGTMMGYRDRRTVGRPVRRRGLPFHSRPIWAGASSRAASAQGAGPLWKTV